MRSLLASEILGYLVDHQEAQDTLEGIAEWWLLERSIRQRLGEVQEAVAELVAEGLVVERRCPGCQTRYQIHRDRLDEARGLAPRRAT